MVGSALLLLLVWEGAAAYGQADEARDDVGESEELSLDELREMLCRQQALIEAQQQRLEDQEDAIRILQAQIDELKSGSEVQTGEEVALKERLQAIESQMQSAAQDVEEVDEDFPGSIRIPGTNMAFKGGGFVNLTQVSSLDAIGRGDRFQTSSIPVTEDDPGEPGTEIAVNRTRLNFDWRMRSRLGNFRAFVEGDFRGEGGELFRLRHAFGQYKNLTVGQTWTTFMDTLNRPEEIDLEGLNGQVQLRQPLARVDLQTEGKLRWSLALENPEPEITGGVGETRIPDVVARALWDREGTRAHMGLVLRSIVGASPTDEEVEERKYGFGLSAGGRVPMRLWDERDHLMVQGTLGRGIGHYVTDLRAEGGQDAVFDDATRKLEVLWVASSFVSFQHWWSEAIRSTFSLGWVWVDNAEIQPDDAYHQTFRAALNALWSPIPNIDLGAELLYGRRENKNLDEGTAFQLQLASYFRF